MAKRKPIPKKAERGDAYSPSESRTRVHGLVMTPREEELAKVLRQLDERPSSRKRKFILALAKYGVVAPAALEVGISFKDLREWRETNDAFRDAWDTACEVANDSLEAAYRYRAQYGVKKPVVTMGKIVKDDDGKPIYITEYSDRAAEFILKGRRAAVYRDTVTHRGDPTQPLYIRTTAVDGDL